MSSRASVSFARGKAWIAVVHTQRLSGARPALLDPAGVAPRLSRAPGSRHPSAGRLVGSGAGLAGAPRAAAVSSLRSRGSGAAPASSGRSLGGRGGRRGRGAGPTRSAPGAAQAEGLRAAGQARHRQEGAAS